MPAKIRLAVYYEATLDSPGRVASEMRLQFADEAPVIGKMEQHVATPFMSSATPTIELGLDKEGDFVVSVKFEGQEWKEIIRKSITLEKKATSSPIETPRPS